MSAIIEGLKLLVAKREDDLRAIVEPTADVTRWTSNYGRNDLRKGNNLAQNVENHAKAVLRAVTEYREAETELMAAQAAKQ